ncbi:MAG TPA: hypothetical protein VFG45_01640 [Candidatus Nitrosocosmicus sp.]|jgi:hypothetical protein|nr:hypothetical protein [Candidatus Nitrosocosmicus sp.]
MSILVIILTIFAFNQSFAQSENLTDWKNYTNNYFNLTLNVPTHWSLTDETSRFDNVKQFYVDTTGVENFDPDNTVRIGIFETDMKEGAKAYLENEKSYFTNPSESNKDNIRIIEDIELNKYNISGGDSYSILYTDDDPTFPTATEKVAFVYNDKGYVVFNVVTPPRFFDDPNITETREKMINSIHFNSDNSTVYNIQQQTEKLNPQTING